ncbi:MAG: M20 family metallopeptidase [Fusicatenibacter sp.]|nr:M20 family metallopeptidase [Fusicatenibacter sp.]
MQMDPIYEEAKSLQTELTANRRWLHAHAEVGFGLTETKEYVKKQLITMGYTPKECGKAGLTVTVGGKKPGKTFLLRADMDALPIREESGEEFSCTNGSMHACGHDMHTAMLLGAARLLKSHEEEICGTVKLMFQPAEEIFEGSHDMIENGVLEDPRPDAAMMIHVTAATPMPSGTIVICAPGVSAPAADYFTIKVQGKGCHGSAPQNGVDALTAAAHILIALQEIQARELSASEEAVLTIGTFNGGNASNAIADSAVLGGTIRTYDEETRSYLKKRMEEIAAAVAGAFRASATVEFGSGCPTLVNDKDLAESMERYLRELLGPGKAFSAAAFQTGGKPSRGGGSEDFAYISQEVPSLMLALAAGEPSKGYQFPQHHPKVRFDEEVLSTGTAVFVCAALRWLEEHRETK